MTEEVIPDGQTRHEPVVNVMNCFFCMKDKKNCGAYLVQFRENCDPILRPYRGQRFAMCPECQERARKEEQYPAHCILSWILSEKKLKELEGRKRKRKGKK
jgi:hypothetical protein